MSLIAAAWFQPNYLRRVSIDRLHLSSLENTDIQSLIIFTKSRMHLMTAFGQKQPFDLNSSLFGKHLGAIKLYGDIHLSLLMTRPDSSISNDHASISNERRFSYQSRSAQGARHGLLAYLANTSLEVSLSDGAPAKASTMLFSLAPISTELKALLRLDDM